MLSLSLLLALVLDRIAPTIRRFRLDYRFHAYVTWLIKQPLCRSIHPRLLPYVFILLPMIVVALLGNMMRLSGFLELAFNLCIAFICLRPQILNEDVDEIIRALENSESFLVDDVRDIFNESNRGLFSLILWMVVVGPVWTLGYRLLVGLLSLNSLPNREIWRKDVYRIIAFMEWLPALVSSYLFMICGNFEAGLRASRNIPLFSQNLGELNNTRLRKTGFAVVEVKYDATAKMTVDTLRRVRGMLLRTLVVWLVLAMIIDYWI